MVAARRLFAAQGYHATGTHDLVALTSVGRGALYHHFTDKQGLFEAVLRQIAAELYDTAAGSVAALSGDPWRQLNEAVAAYLEAVAASREVQRILLIDGPAVLGWERWKGLRAEYLLNGYVITLGMLMDRGIVAEQPKEPLAQLIQAVVDEAALAIAHSDVPTATQRAYTRAVLNLIGGLRVSS